MRTVNIAELKNRLSAYITYAKAGEEIIIRDRTRPVARLMPLIADSNLTDHELAMVASGQMRLARQPWNPDALLQMPIPKVRGNVGTQAILAEREEGM